MPSVYLAGPISGLTFEGSTNWRRVAAEVLHDHGIDAFSPLRGKDVLQNVGVIGCGDYGDLSPLASTQGVVTRDRFDATHCDVLLVNLLGAERVSIGTMIELGWADANRIPIVLAMEDGNTHDHMMVRGMAGYIVPDLMQAVSLVVAILSPMNMPVAV